MKDWPDFEKRKICKCAYKIRQHFWLQKNLNINKTVREFFFYLSFTLLVELVEFLTGFVFRLYYFLLFFRQVLGVQKKVINHHDMSCHVFNVLCKLAKENEILVQSFSNEK